MRALLFSLLFCLAARHAVRAQVSFFDPSFGNGGKVVIPLSSTDNGMYYAVAVQADGKIVAAGIVRGLATIARFKANGTPDSAFATNGNYTGPENSSFRGVAIQPDGKIVAVGDSSIAFGDDAFNVVRLNADGSQDNTFGTGGVSLVDFTTSNDHATGLKLQPDGKIVVLGGASTSIGVVRLLSDGTLDSGFGIGGKATFATYGDATSIAIAPDGKIILGGQRYSGFELMAIRLLPDGTPDPSFNGTGMAYALVGDTWNYGNAVAVRPDGKVIVAGQGTMAGQGSNIAVVRFNTNGSPDGSFGTGGKVNLDIQGQDDGANAVVLYPDGRILLCGSATATNEDFCVVRLTSNGVPDSSFGENGKIVNAIGSAHDYVRAAVFQPDGKIVLAGYSRRPDAPYDAPALARYLSGPSGIGTVSGADHYVRIFPNPAAGKIYLPAGVIPRLATVEAIDALGRTTRLPWQAGSASVDISSLANGPYCIMLRLSDGGVVCTSLMVDKR